MVIPKPPSIWIWGQTQGRTGGGLLKIWDMGKSSILAISPYSCTKVCLSKIWYTKDEIVIYQSKFWEKKKIWKISIFGSKRPFWPISWISRYEPKQGRPPLCLAFFGQNNNNWTYPEVLKKFRSNVFPFWEIIAFLVK